MNETKCFMDSDVIVNAFVNLNKKKNQASQALLKKLEQGIVILITDYLVLTESHYIISKFKGVQKATEVIRHLISLDGLKIIDVNAFIFFEALKRTEKYKLKTNDLIHYTVALLNEASFIYSYDKHFNRLEVKRIEP